MLAIAVLVVAAAEGSGDRSACRTDLDCCGSTCLASGSCSCHAGYKGASCCALDLGACQVALHPNHTWTWGAAPRWSTSDAGNRSVEILAMGLRNRCGINSYRYNAYIMQARAPSPLGPFMPAAAPFMPGRPPRFDATEVEDPNVVELAHSQGTLLFYTGAWWVYVLFYTGDILAVTLILFIAAAAVIRVNGDAALNCSTKDQPQPDSAKLAGAQRIGVAYRPPGDSEWQRSAAPILSTRAGKWDSTRVSNPAALVYPNGTVLLAYRGNGAGRGGIGMAIAPHWSGPYTHLLDQPLFSGYCEDPTLYLDAQGLVHMIAHGELQPQPTFNVRAIALWPREDVAAAAHMLCYGERAGGGGDDDGPGKVRKCRGCPAPILSGHVVSIRAPRCPADAHARRGIVGGGAQRVEGWQALEPPPGRVHALRQLVLRGGAAPAAAGEGNGSRSTDERRPAQLMKTPPPPPRARGCLRRAGARRRRCCSPTTPSAGQSLCSTPRCRASAATGRGTRSATGERPAALSPWYLPAP